jgi:hypothetical protein
LEIYCQSTNPMDHTKVTISFDLYDIFFVPDKLESKLQQISLPITWCDFRMSENMGFGFRRYHIFLIVSPGLLSRVEEEIRQIIKDSGGFFQNQETIIGKHELEFS